MRSQQHVEEDWLDRLSLEEFEEYERRFRWVALQARPEQLTPEGDWKTWLLLAGRGFGKTRTAAEDMVTYGLNYPKSNIAIVAETFADGRDVCIEGESGLLSCLSPTSVAHWNRSIGELFLKNGTKYRLFSGDKPSGLRGYNHHRAWTDELAKFMYPDETWTQLQLGLRAGANPRNVVTTTPKPIPLIRELVERDNVVVTSGSTYDNAANLAPSFLDEVRRLYEGTDLGEQELHGRIVLLDGESAFKEAWWTGQNRYLPEEAYGLWNACIGRYAALDTANKAEEHNAYSALTVGDLQDDYSLPLRYVARERLEFPDLVDWVIDELAPFNRDSKLRAVIVEDAASGTQLIQTLRRSAPQWLRHMVVAVKPPRGGKPEAYKSAAVWAKRGMMPLPHPSPLNPWLHEYEKELFAVPNSTYADQADSTAMLINYLEERHSVFSRRWRKLGFQQSKATRAVA